MPHETPRKLEYADLLRTPEDGKRYEIIRGELFVTTSFTPIHQRISRRIARQLRGYFHPQSHEVFGLPVDVILSKHDVLVPDILVVADPADVTERAIEGPPLLVVEIISPETRERDLGIKRERYAELAVSHYWIVDADRYRIECLRLEQGAYRERIAAEGETMLAHPDFDALVIDVAALWRPSPALGTADADS